jgi:hypothetical protein
MALVLRSPFTSLADVGRVHYPFLPVRLLLRDRYASIEQVGGLRCPVLVLAGAGTVSSPGSRAGGWLRRFPSRSGWC